MPGSGILNEPVSGLVVEPVPENRSSTRSFICNLGAEMGIAFEDVETDRGGVLGDERDFDGGRELRSFSQLWLRERPLDSSDDSSPINGLVSNEGESEFTRPFPWASVDNWYGGSNGY
jgi:hypothetical protein